MKPYPREKLWGIVPLTKNDAIYLLGWIKHKCLEVFLRDLAPWEPKRGFLFISDQKGKGGRPFLGGIFSFHYGRRGARLEICDM